MTCEKHGGGTGSIFCKYCDAEVIAMHIKAYQPISTENVRLLLEDIRCGLQDAYRLAHPKANEEGRG